MDQNKTPSSLSRRCVVLTGSMAGLALSANGLALFAKAAAEDRPLAPRTEFVFEALVDIAPTLDLGAGPLGRRLMVPITGGTFEGPRIRGKVLPGGADRQLVRSDGIKTLTATYELQTDDGAVIGVVNHVTIDAPPGKPRYAFSTLDITAPEGPYGWLNRSAFVGTLVSLRPAREAVRITVYRLV